MKRYNTIFVLIILAVLFVPLAYIYIIFIVLKDIINNRYKTLGYVRDNKYLMIISIVCLITIICSKYIQISSFFGMMIFVCILTTSYVYLNADNIDKNKLLKVIYITALITYVIGIAQMIDPTYVMPKKWVDVEEYNLKKRMFSTFFNPNIFGFYINLIIMTICVNMTNVKSKSFSLLEKTTFIFSIICLFLTFSRTSWLSLISSLLVTGIFIDRKYIKYAIFMIVCIYGADTLLGVNRADITKLPNDSSLFYRIELWKTGLRIIKDNLITGIGFGTFFKYTSSYSSIITKYIEHCHNIYIQIVLETGIIGLITFLITMFSVCKRILKEYFMDKNNKFNILVILILCMSLIHGMVDSVSLTPQIMMLLSCLTGVSLYKYKNHKVRYEN